MAEFELGVIIKTEGAEEGADQLDKFSVAAKGAADASNDLSQAQSKINRGGMGLGGFGTGLDTNIVRPAEKAQEAVTATGKSIGFLQSIWQGMRAEFARGFNWEGVFGLFSKGADDAATGMKSAHSASTLFREGLYLLNPVMAATGTQMSNMRGYASLARTGIIGIATAITAVLITSLEKAAETIELTERSLKHLLDSSALGTGAGARIFDEMRAAADRMGVSVNSLREGVGALGLALQRTGEGGPKWIGDAPSAVNNATKAFEAFTDAIRVDQKDMTSSIKIANDFINSLTKLETTEQRMSKLGANWQIETTLTKVQKNAGLTLDAFLSLEKNAPLFASIIAQAYNTDIAGMEKLLQRGPRALQEMLSKVQMMVPRIQAELSKLTPTVAGGWDQFTSAIGKLWAEIGRTTGVSTASRIIETLTDRIKKMNDEISKGGGVWASFWHQMPSGGDVWKGMMAGSTESVEDFARTIRNAWNSILQYVSSSNLWKIVSANARDEWEIIVQIAMNAWNRIKSLPTDIWSGFSSLASAAWNSVAQMANNTWAIINAGARSAVDTASQYIMSIVQRTVSVIQQLISVAAQALSSLRAGAAGGAGGSFGGPSFVVDASGNQANYVGGYGQGYYASGGAFQVKGPGGTDSVPVRFMATPGEVVTITPNNLTTPANMAGMATANNLQATGLAQGGGTATAVGVSADAITDPITFAVKDSSGKVVGAVDNATDAIKAMAATIKTAATSGGTTIGAAGGRPIYTYSGKAGTSAGPLGSGPIDAYGNIVPATVQTYIARINYNSAIAGMPQPPGNPVYAINPNYVGQFAGGGSFIATTSGALPGGTPLSNASAPVGGTDSLLYSMRLTPGERVTITPPSGLSAGGTSWADDSRLQSLMKAIKTNADDSTANVHHIATAKKIGDTRPINIYIYGVQNPMAFVASEASIKRSVRRAMG